MSELTWDALARVAAPLIPFGGPVVSGLELLRDSVNETNQELNMLQEAPMTAGFGFLDRAAREQPDRERLIRAAQDSFTALMRHPLPLLASRACFYVGFCHLLLPDQVDLARPYFVDACERVLVAIERCEAERFRPLSASVMLRSDEARAKRAAAKYGIGYEVRSCPETDVTVRYPVKDGYIRALETLVGVSLPICCVDHIHRLCREHQLNRAYISGSASHWRTLSRRSPYFREKAALQGSLRTAPT
jgi:hypothetical protein